MYNCTRIITLLAIVLLRSMLGSAGATQAGASSHTMPRASGSVLYLPLVRLETSSCPASSVNQYAAIPVLPPPTDRPAAEHADLNLALRGFEAASQPLALIDYGGDHDPDAPQLRGVFSDNRIPDLVSTGRIFSWDWECGTPEGCRGPAIAEPPVTILGMHTVRGEPLSIPSRTAEIYIGGFKALVLYADDRRLTLKYTREDNVVSGYTVHFEDICVDPNLLIAYRQADLSGRSSLPALRNGEVLGTALGEQVRVAVRDSGSFMDPRSRADWWRQP